MTLLIMLVILGGLCIAGGAGWIYPPAGAITAGVLLLAVAYVYGYLKARK